jgi:hypothetical protein
MLRAQSDAATQQAELALAAFDTVKGIRPAEVAPRYAVASAILALRPGQDSQTSAKFALEALDLIEPFFRRRARSLQREMNLVITALRETGEMVPADILTLLQTTPRI